MTRRVKRLESTPDELAAAVAEASQRALVPSLLELCPDIPSNVSGDEARALAAPHVVIAALVGHLDAALANSWEAREKQAAAEAVVVRLGEAWSRLRALAPEQMGQLALLDDVPAALATEMEGQRSLLAEGAA